MIPQYREYELGFFSKHYKYFFIVISRIHKRLLIQLHCGHLLSYFYLFQTYNIFISQQIYGIFPQKLVQCIIIRHSGDMLSYNRMLDFIYKSATVFEWRWNHVFANLKYSILELVLIPCEHSKSIKLLSPIVSQWLYLPNP